MQKKSWLLGVVAGAILVGCGPSITVTNNVPLNLAYKTGVMAAPKTNQTIILLKPALQYSDNIAKEYSNKFRDELTLKVQSLLENQGYKVAISDVSDKNDLSFAQKKDSYLVLEMNGEVVLRPDPKTTEQKKIPAPDSFSLRAWMLPKARFYPWGILRWCLLSPPAARQSIRSWWI
ncbi:Neuraminyllactose-binding hemagglutinin (N-acetylneuraminyllactose-binding fibrillar hemagglutinin receptor-binding subunit) (NLBH) (Flagellar sheath adhesin) (Adhesin A) (Fragment) [Helicobacter bizzozeronii CCUG 35545]